MKTNLWKDGVAEVIIDNVLMNVINWKSFDSNYLEMAVANDASIKLLVTTWNVKMHFKATVVCEWKAYYKSYIGWTYTGGTAPDNTKLSVLARNATVNYTSWVTLKYWPTVSVLGTQRANLLIIGGTWPHSTGGTSGTSESIIWPNTTFLIDLQNKSGQAKDMQVILEWYEETI